MGEKKTMDEYQNLGPQFHTMYTSMLLTHRADKEDDAMVRWKESLGLATGKDISNPKDPRKVILFSLGLESAGRPDIVIDLTKPGALEALKTKPFVIKEGVTFNMIATFQVQHEILAGMKYVQVVKRGPLHHKMQEMIVSCATLGTDLVLTMRRAPFLPTQKTSASTRRNVSMCP